MKIKILPTILVKDKLALEEKIEEFDELVERIQMDVVDGDFSMEPTLGLEAMLEPPTISKRDVHLMVNEPIEYLETCEDLAAEMVVGQIENMGSQIEFIEKAHGLGMKAGLAIDLETGVEELDWEAVKESDQVLVMAVRAGKAKQKLEKQALEKVKKIRAKGFLREICVDGGVNEKTIKDCIKAGADVMAVGSCLWLSKDKRAKLEELYRLAEE